MSKKIASGAEKIVLDVTVGNGAFMKTTKEAEELAKTMINIGKLANRETICILTNMEEPLGYAVGNNLEVKEAVKFLKGEMPEDLKEVVFELGAYMIKLAGLGENIEENKQKLQENILNKKGYEKLLEMVKNQDGDITYLQDLEKFPKAKYIKEITAKEDGFIEKIPAKEIGKIACYLGAGRERKEDEIDNSVGIVLNKKIGDKVEKGEIILKIFANGESRLKEAEEKIKEIISISKERNKVKTILKTII